MKSRPSSQAVAAPRRKSCFRCTKRTRSSWGSPLRIDLSCRGSISVWDGSLPEVRPAVAASEARPSTGVPAGILLRRVLLAVQFHAPGRIGETVVPLAGEYRGLQRGPLFHSPLARRNIDTRTSGSRAGTSRARGYVMKSCSIGSHGPPCPRSLRRACLPTEVGQTPTPPTAPPGRATCLVQATTRTARRGE
jgi:hypothetical protein